MPDTPTLCPCSAHGCNASPAYYYSDRNTVRCERHRILDGSAENLYRNPTEEALNDSWTLETRTLKPCPFCGDEARIYSVDLRPLGTRYNAGCDNSDCDCHCDFRAATEVEAARLWNTRVPARGEPSDEAVREPLLDVIGSLAIATKAAESCLAALDRPTGAREPSEAAVEAYRKGVQSLWPRLESRELRRERIRAGLRAAYAVDGLAAGGEGA